MLFRSCSRSSGYVCYGESPESRVDLINSTLCSWLCSQSPSLVSNHLLTGKRCDVQWPVQQARGDGRMRQLGARPHRQGVCRTVVRLHRRQRMHRLFSILRSHGICCLSVSRHEDLPRMDGSVTGRGPLVCHHLIFCGGTIVGSMVSTTPCNSQVNLSIEVHCLLSN